MEKSSWELTADVIKRHNENAEIRNKVSKGHEMERRSKTAECLGLKSTEAAVKNNSSQLELDKSKINSDSFSTSTSESFISNNINKLKQLLKLSK